MKFLRLAFYVLIAQLVLSGCAGEGVEETSSSSASEINFDAYVGRNASTRSSITDIDFLKKDLDSAYNAGFGVFAIYRHTDKTIPPLMLLNNEHVYWKNWNGDHSDWGYEHTRYWPSEGSVDFYAFAPHSDVPRLERPDSDPDKADTYIYFPSSINPIDLVWANAKDQTKADNPVKFTFRHALARFGFDITANNLNDGDFITVQEVKLYGATEWDGVFVMGGYLNLENGDWIVRSKEPVKWYYTWTLAGNEVEGPGMENGGGPQLKLTGEKLDNNNIIENSPQSFIFIIPQKMETPFFLRIKYTVVKQGIPQPQVTVTKNLLEVLRKPGTSYFEFEKGKRYDFHLKLSPNSSHSRVTTNVKNWDVDVDVVNNVPCNQIGR